MSSTHEQSTALAPRAPATHAAPAFLRDHALRLLVFGGKGGVGKTTCASSAAIALATSRPRARILLLSTDPAHSVADCLGPEPSCTLPPNLCVIELSAQQEHARFMAEHAQHLRTIASRGTFLDGTDIDQFIELSIPGVDELMAFLRVAQWLEEDAFDTIVIDTAPSGHTLRLLAMSDLLTTWLGALDALLAKHRYMAGLFGGRKQSTTDTTDAFLDSMRSRVELLSGVLRDSTRARFVPVMLAEPMSVSETCDLLTHLDAMGVAAPEVVLNRLVGASAGPAFAQQSALQRDVLASLPAALSSRRIWAAPLMPHEQTGPVALAGFGGSLRPLAQWMPSDDAPAPSAKGSHAPFQCRGTFALPAQAPAPDAGARLLLLVGKGGVGKTTMACTAATFLASQGQRCLLVSTDPAHSVSDCLGTAVHDQPTPVRPNLDALEVDAAKEFESLRSQYQDELQRVLEKMFDSLDVSFDREAMEKLLDLAPPGLDECMALLRIMDHVGGAEPAPAPLSVARLRGTRRPSIAAPAQPRRYDTIVIDTAPTGHMLRLLEAPELIDRWLGCIFKLFVKYDNVFRLPLLQARLVQISRSVKRLRAMVVDPARCEAHVVSILTEMALAEAQDLVASLRSMRVPVGTLVLNLALPDGPSHEHDELARAVRAREQRTRAAYERMFPDLPQVVVARTADPRGEHGLAALAQALCSPRSAGPAQPGTREAAS